MSKASALLNTPKAQKSRNDPTFANFLPKVVVLLLVNEALQLFYVGRKSIKICNVIAQLPCVPLVKSTILTLMPSLQAEVRLCDLAAPAILVLYSALTCVLSLVDFVVKFKKNVLQASCAFALCLSCRIAKF